MPLDRMLDFVMRLVPKIVNDDRGGEKSLRDFGDEGCRSAEYRAKAETDPFAMAI